jgi:hypothetical protein
LREDPLAHFGFSPKRAHRIVDESKYQVARDRGLKTADRTVARGVPNRVPFGYKRNGIFVDGDLASQVDPDKDPQAVVPLRRRGRRIST